MFKKRDHLKYYSVLLFCCFVAFFGLTLVHIIEGKSLICDADALDLYFNFFVYEGDWIRDTIVCFLQTGKFDPQLYSFNEGLGADVFYTTAGCFNDPFNLLSALVPSDYAEYAFEFLVFLRFYLAAVTFSVYSFSRRHSFGATLCGALCYVGCGFVVFWGVLGHPNFINVTILLPLILLGADKVFKRESPLIFIIAMGFQLLFSVYFTYMTCIVLLIYCLVKCFYILNIRSPKVFLGHFLRFLLYIFIAFLLAGIVAIPEIIALSSMGRVGLERTVPVLFDFNYYWEYVYRLFGGYESQNAITIGVLPSLCIVILLALRKSVSTKEEKAWAFGAIACLIGSLIPFVGHVMNGFGYVTDRWLFILGFSGAYAVTLSFSHLGHLSKKEKKIITVIYMTLIMISALFAADQKSIHSIFVVFFALVALVFFVYVIQRIPNHIGKLIISIMLIIANISLMSCIYNSSIGSNFSEKFIDKGEALSTIQRLAFLNNSLSGLEEEYRVDRAYVYGTRNAGLVNRFNSMDFYSSFYNQELDNFNTDLGLTGDYLNYRFNGYDQRYALNRLLGAKYFVVNVSDEDEVPYQYTKRIGALKEEQYDIYETSNALPIVYSSKNEISERQFNSSNSVEKQEILTNGYVLSNSDSDECKLTTENEGVEVSNTNGLTIADGIIDVQKENASLTIKVKGKEGSENYVCFDNLVFQSKDKSISFSSFKEFLKSLKYSKGSSTRISATSGNISKSFGLVTPASASYGGKANFALNMGYSTEKVKEYTISFSQKGIYRYSNIYVAHQPIKVIEDNLDKLAANNTADFTLENNGISATLDVLSGEKTRALIVSVPYSSGWSASVDGESADIVKVNESFMAVIVEGEGTHRIELNYVTPGLKFGGLCSLIGLASLVSLLILRKRKLFIHESSDNSKNK